jgi:hypothetical protein
MPEKSVVDKIIHGETELEYNRSVLTDTTSSPHDPWHGAGVLWVHTKNPQGAPYTEHGFSENSHRDQFRNRIRYLHFNEDRVLDHVWRSGRPDENLANALVTLEFYSLPLAMVVVHAVPGGASFVLYYYNRCRPRVVTRLLREAVRDVIAADRAKQEHS